MISRRRAKRDGPLRRKPLWQRRRRRLLIVLTLFGVVAGVFLYWRIGVRKDLEERIALVREAKLPLTYAELEEWYAAVPEEENGATVYLRAINSVQLKQVLLLENLPFFSNQHGIVGDALDEATLVSIDSLLEENREFTELMRKGREYERARYPKPFASNWKPGGGFYLGSVQPIVNLCALQALKAALNGDGQKAKESMLDILGLARSFENAPWWNGQTSRYECHETFTQALMEALSRTSLDGGILDELDGEITDELEYTEGPFHEYAGERCLWLGLIDKFTGSENAATRAITSVMNAIGHLDLSLTAYHDVWREHIDLLGLPWKQYIDEYEKATKRYYANDPWPQMFHFAPSPSRHFVDRMRLELAHVAIALERYRNDVGTYPGDLAELVPNFISEVPMDMFSEEDLLYRPANGGYLLYSVGRNETDEGGHVRSDIFVRVAKRKRPASTASE